MSRQHECGSLEAKTRYKVPKRRHCTLVYVNTEKVLSSHSPMFAKLNTSSPVSFIFIATAKDCLSILLRKVAEALKLA